VLHVDKNRLEYARQYGRPRFTILQCVDDNYRVTAKKTND